MRPRVQSWVFWLWFLLHLVDTALGQLSVCHLADHQWKKASDGTPATSRRREQWERPGERARC